MAKRALTSPRPDAPVADRFDRSFSCQLRTVAGLPFSGLQSALRPRAIDEQLRKLPARPPTLHRPYFASLWAWAIANGRWVGVSLQVKSRWGISGNKKVHPSVNRPGRQQCDAARKCKVALGSSVPRRMYLHVAESEIARWYAN